MTGRRLGGTSHVLEERQEQLSALHERLFSPREREVPERQGKVASYNYLDDDEVLRKATSAANGARFAALWAGDRSGNTSHSEADLALCSMLAFWVGPDETRISSLFSHSGLMRKKWNREDYRRRTISRAILRAKFYTPAKDEAVQPTRNGHHRDAETPVVAAHPTPPEATATEIYQALQEAGCEVLPAAPRVFMLIVSSPCFCFYRRSENLTTGRRPTP